MAPETLGAVGEGNAACSTLAESTIAAAATIQHVDNRETKSCSYWTPRAVRLSDELNCYSAKLAEIGVQRIALAREYDARE